MATTLTRSGRSAAAEGTAEDRHNIHASRLVSRRALQRDDQRAALQQAGTSLKGRVRVTKKGDYELLEGTFSSYQKGGNELLKERVRVTKSEEYVLLKVRGTCY